MFRAIPVSNKILKRRWDERTQAIHYEKLRNMKSHIDSGKPATLGISKGRAKKEQIVEGNCNADRYQEIERENRLLLDKMTNIMQTHSFKTTGNRFKKSLNKDLRKRDLIKITLENQALLKRLTEKQACYKTDKWEGERLETEKLLGNICEYPYQLGITREFRTRGGSREQGIVESQATTGFRATLRKSQSSSLKPQRLAPLNTKKSVFKRGVNISGRYFIVEMSTDNVHVLELPYQEAVRLMGTYDSYETLVAMFSFDEDGQLVLKDARGSHPDLTSSQSDPLLTQLEHEELSKQVRKPILKAELHDSSEPATKPDSSKGQKPAKEEIEDETGDLEREGGKTQET